MAEDIYEIGFEVKDGVFVESYRTQMPIHATSEDFGKLVYITKNNRFYNDNLKYPYSSDSHGLIIWMHILDEDIELAHDICRAYLLKELNQKIETYQRWLQQTMITRSVVFPEYKPENILEKHNKELFEKCNKLDNKFAELGGMGYVEAIMNKHNEIYRTRIVLK